MVQQLFAEFRSGGDGWSLEVLFDAGYADPEMRANPESPQPQREWLVAMDRDGQRRLCEQAEEYLREILELRAGDAALAWRAEFPDFDTEPPDFPSLLNDGAYVRVLLRPAADDPQGGLRIALAPGEHPDLVVEIDGEGEARYLTLKPGDVEILRDPVEQPGREPWGAAFTQGFLHVVPGGLDHILFVLGIFLLKRAWRPLLSQSLAFTAAHTITLGLAAAGLVSVPGSLVEPLIALSITALAVENLFDREAKPWRLAVVFAFGLVHGLGFAGVLSTWIRPGEGFLSSLLSANLGVEAGQVVVLLAAWALTAPLHRLDHWPAIRNGCCIALALTGLWWFAGRVGWL